MAKFFIYIVSMQSDKKVTCIEGFRSQGQIIFL